MLVESVENGKDVKAILAENKRALACELGLDWRAVRGLGVMARAVGLVGHILEESRQPIAEEVWRRIEEEASAHLRRES